MERRSERLLMTTGLTAFRRKEGGMLKTEKSDLLIYLEELLSVPSMDSLRLLRMGVPEFVMIL